MEKQPLQPIGFIDNVPPAPSRPDEVSPESQTDSVVDFSKIPPLPRNEALAYVSEDVDDVLPTDIVRASDSEVPKKEQEPLSPEAQAFYMSVYEQARDVITAHAAEHPDQYQNLVDAASRFVKEHFKNDGDVREYALAHVCGGSTPDPATLRYLDTDESNFYNLIKTHTGIDVYADEEAEDENR